MSTRLEIKGMKFENERVLKPNLRFPEFRVKEGWAEYTGNKIFEQINERNTDPNLPVLAITQEYGAIPRDAIDYHVSVTDKSIENYKVVRVGDFIISLRSFQGGIEFSQYDGICSPAYVILRRIIEGSDVYFKHYLKTDRFIGLLSRNLEGLRDGKMVSYKQFSELSLPVPSLAEQNKVAECLTSLDELIDANGKKLDTLKAHKKGLMQQLFPGNGKNRPMVRFPAFQNGGEWLQSSVGELVEAGCLYAPKDGNHGNLHPKSSDFVAEGIPFIMASDLNGGQIDTTNCHFITKALADTLQKGFAREGDILLSHKGTVGEVAVVKSISTPYLMLTPQVTYYRVKDKTRCSNSFLAQLFVTDEFQRNLKIAAGGGTRAYIGITEQGKLGVSLPPELHEQQVIADCFSSLDDLILAQSDELGALKTHKEGLVQQLFASSEVKA
jgi:type I restriction enzyme S subunit